MHVTLRVCDGMPSLRADAMFSAVRGAFGRASRKAINRALRRRGRVWIGCYHAHTLKTPREVRNALIYVLQNFKKHIRGATGLD